MVLELFKEGLVNFYAENSQLKKALVFFNPSREFDRSMNVLLLKALGGREMYGIDLFAASGVRGLRLASETDSFAEMIVNDIATDKIITKNIDINLKVLKSKVSALKINALNIFSLNRRFDYIDIDPFGSPARFLSAAMSVVKNGSIIAVTATDTAALYGSANKACVMRYGVKSRKTSYYNELGLRILLKRTEEIANMYERSIRPILFDVRHHYVRAYLQIKGYSLTKSLGFLYQCERCPNRMTEPTERCDVCGFKMLKIGPIWLGRLFDRDIVRRMHSATIDERIRKYTETLSNEIDVPTYYTTDELAKFLKKSEKRISEFENRTVLDPKGFRYRGCAKELLR